jgi:integrase
MTNLTILIYLKSRLNSKGEQPIYIRITVDGKRKEKSLNRTIKLSNWDTQKQRAKGTGENARILNEFLTAETNKIYKSRHELDYSGQKVSVSSLVNLYSGSKKKAPTLIEVFEFENTRTKKLVALGTYKKYDVALKHIKNYLKHQYNVTDFDISCIDYQFVIDFDFYLRSERRISNNSTIRIVKILQQIVKTTIDKGWIAKDPFSTYKPKKEAIQTGYLTKDEIDRICNKEFSIGRLVQVRDVFIVCCYTGLAYADVNLLSQNDITTTIDGTQWITINRKKTNTISKIPLLPIVAQIFDRYKDNPLVLNSGKLLPVPSNQRMNAYLKEIGDICGIKTVLTSHLARHSFATSIALPFGLPIETLSKVMGHKSLNMTLHYGKLIETKLLSDVAKFAENLKNSNIQITSENQRNVV